MSGVLFEGYSNSSLTYSNIQLLDTRKIQVSHWVNGTAVGVVQSGSAIIDDTWNHVVVQFDSANATAASRVRIYINQDLSVAVASPVLPVDQDGMINSTANIHMIGAGHINNSSPATAFKFNGRLADLHFIDGTIKGPDEFGVRDPSSNFWVPKKYGGTYGTNGYNLHFGDATQFGKDTSGSNSNWTVNGTPTVNTTDLPPTCTEWE